jgi:hypothetical protein
MKKTRKEYGTSLEQTVANKFVDMGFKNARPSKGSGAVNRDGDVIGQPLCHVEAKQRNTKNITLKEDVWLKLCNEIPLHSEKFPLYVLGNANNKKWAVIDLDDFFRLLECYNTIQQGDA